MNISTFLVIKLGNSLFGRRPNRVLEIVCFDSKLQQASNTCERWQAKRRECLPRERLVQGKKHARNKALLAGNLIPLLRNSERCEDEEIGLLHQLITWSSFGKHENSSLLKSCVSIVFKSLKSSTKSLCLRSFKGLYYWRATKQLITIFCFNFVILVPCLMDIGNKLHVSS